MRVNCVHCGGPLMTGSALREAGKVGERDIHYLPDVWNHGFQKYGTGFVADASE